MYDIINAGTNNRFTVGGVLVHNCGYGGSVNALRAFGAKGTDLELKRKVGAYRRANPNLVKFWYELKDTFITGGRVGKHLYIKRSGSARQIILPSGRPIVYHGVQVKEGRYGPEPYYRDWRKGGHLMPLAITELTENVASGMARDLIMVAMARLEAAGIRIVMHVHDELVAEGRHYQRIYDELTRVPAWAEGLPLDAAGEVVRRYRKG